MKRDLLIGMAVGAGLSSAAYVAAGQLKPPLPKPNAKMRIYELGYQRPRSPMPDVFKGIPDPLTAALPSQALVELASNCEVQQYKLDAMDQGGFGGNPSAFLHIDPARLSNRSFNCLTERLRPPYLTLSIIEVCRSMMEKSPANPPCKEPIP